MESIEYESRFEKFYLKYVVPATIIGGLLTVTISIIGMVLLK